MNAEILIVEDDSDTSRGLAIELQSSGFLVLQAVNAVSALGAAPSDLPDLIVLAFGPPNGDGYNVIEELRPSSTTH